MTKYADTYYAMSTIALWRAFRDGWPGALAALIDRCDGHPPIARDGLPPAAAWAEILAGAECPFTVNDAATGAVTCGPSPTAVGEGLG